nr:trypsin-like serine protease [Paraglaciecola sp. G1-23]
MPFEGAGVLIDKHWILVPAHVIYTFHYDYIDKPLMIHGVENQIKEIIFHPDRKQGDTDWGEGNPKALMDSLNKHTDIALIRLSYPVTHINPIKRYQGESELGQTITVYGKGAVGTGLTGEI